MNIIKLFFSLLIFPAIAIGSDIQNYKIVDLGIFGMDKSYSLALNDKGQVLGECFEGSFHSFFLWTDNAIKFIDIPEDCITWSTKINKKGQITGICSNNFNQKIFIWDERTGFQIVYSSKEGIKLIDFNDKGKILCKIGNQLFVLSNKQKLNLTTLFKNQINGDWTDFQATALNTHGQVACSAYKRDSEDGIYGRKSFIFKEGIFEMIMPEKDWTTSVEVRSMDDEGNIIVDLYPREGGSNIQYFIDSIKGTVIPCNGSYIIRNGIPITRDCSPSKIKLDRNGRPYFLKGVEIKKLLRERYPFYNLSNLDIRDQNVKGQVIGTCQTIYPGEHAFLAIPIPLEESDLKR